MRLHGNVYDLGNGFYQGQIYNLLEGSEGGQLDGHYTFIFNKDASIIYTYKHGDYANLVSYINVEFKGFITLNEYDHTRIKSAILTTMAGKMPYNHPDRRFASEAIFDYHFDLITPVYWEYLKKLVG